MPSASSARWPSTAGITVFHPRLRRMSAAAMAAIGVLLIAIWVTLAVTKLHALIFVCTVLIVGLTLRQVTSNAAAAGQNQLASPVPSSSTDSEAPPSPNCCWRRLIGDDGDAAMESTALRERRLSSVSIREWR